MWWGCQSTWYGACCRSMEWPRRSQDNIKLQFGTVSFAASKTSELLLLRRVVGVGVLAVFDCRLEVADSFSKAFAESGKLARTKEKKRDADNQQNVQRRK